MYARENRAIFSFCTNDGLFTIFIGWLYQTPTDLGNPTTHMPSLIYIDVYR